MINTQDKKDEMKQKPAETQEMKKADVVAKNTSDKVEHDDAK